VATYYLTYTENTYEICSPDPDDDWDHGQYGVTVLLHDLYPYNPECPHHQIESESYNDLFGVEEVKQGEIAYVVLVIYQDGDTFGSSGYWTVPGIFSDANRAEQLVKDIENGKAVTTKYMLPWDGYFASLSSAEVIPMVVLP
jgi:hypothetical protein